MPVREISGRTGILSEFARKQLETAELADIGDRVARGELLGREDARRLSDAPLPLLAKLVELVPKAGPDESPKVEPVLFVRLAEWLASGEFEAAVANSAVAIREAAARLAALAEEDERVRGFGECVYTLHVVADDPGDPVRHALTAAFDAISNDAVPAGVTVSAGVLHDPKEVAEESRAAGAMRSIAIRRLSSRLGTEIRAPVSELGIQAAQAALAFGADHLGQVAVDSETAEVLQIPTLVEIASALRYDTPTPL